jgi:hypothetical protein
MKLIREKLVVRSMTLLLSLGGVSGMINAPASAAARPTHRGRKAPVAKDKERDKVKPRSKTSKPASAVAAPMPAASTPATFTSSNTGAPAATPAAFKTDSSGGGGTTAPAAVTPPAATSSPPPSAAPPAASVALADATPPAEVPSSSSGATETPAAPPGAAQAPPPAGPVSFVEHLGPEAYPDRMRGLHGGSLWLEPSFHGLQWPYMPRTGVGLSGYVWADNGYETITRGQPTLPNTVEWVQQARAAVRVTPTYSNQGFFVQGQLELVGNKDQIQSQTSNTGVVDTDDLWIRVGNWNSWDVKVGRFEGWELYHTGMGLDINTIERRGATQTNVPGAPNFERPDYYGVTYLHDRPNGQGVGNIAGHIYPLDFLRFELLTQIGVSDYISGGDNVLGARGAGILDLGWLKLKVGGEYVHKTKSLDRIVTMTDMNGNSMPVKERSKAVGSQRGVGGTAQVIIGRYLEAGVSGGIAIADQTNDKGDPIDTAATNTYSGGAFATVALGTLLLKDEDLLLGVGANYTSQTDQHRDTMLSDPNDPNSPMVPGRIDFTANLQAFGALQYMVAHQLFVKAVVAYARSDFDLSFGGGIYSNTMWSGRLRLMYLF